MNITRGRHAVVGHFISCIERLIPMQLADRSWDNVGLILESPLPKPSKDGSYRVLLTIDLTEPVYEEALQKEVSFIVAYHPPWFRAEKSLTLDSSRGLLRMVTLCAASGITIYSPHSAIDSMVDGNAEWVANILSNGQLADLTPIKPSVNQPQAGLGRLLTLSSSTTVHALLKRWSEHTGQSNLRVAFPRGMNYKSSVTKIAICVGSGASVLVESKADLYFTGEMSHHEILRSTIGEGAIVVLTEHTNCERGYLRENLLPQLQHSLIESSQYQFETFCSEQDRDPIEYFTLTEG